MYLGQDLRRLERKEVVRVSDKGPRESRRGDVPAHPEQVLHVGAHLADDEGNGRRDSEGEADGGDGGHPEWRVDANNCDACWAMPTTDL